MCCNRVMVTSQAFTMRYGTTYTCIHSHYLKLLSYSTHVNLLCQESLHSVRADVPVTHVLLPQK